MWAQGALQHDRARAGRGASAQGHPEEGPGTGRLGGARVPDRSSGGGVHGAGTPSRGPAALRPASAAGAQRTKGAGRPERPTPDPRAPRARDSLQANCAAAQSTVLVSGPRLGPRPSGAFRGRICLAWGAAPAPASAPVSRPGRLRVRCPQQGGQRESPAGGVCGAPAALRTPRSTSAREMGAPPAPHLAAFWPAPAWARPLSGNGPSFHPAPTR